MKSSSLYFLTVFTFIFNLLCVVRGHIVAWHKGTIYLLPDYYFSTIIGMYCLNGTTGVDEQSTNEAVNPLYQVR